jgi:predicted DNA-binding transcriptional regulator YafY
MRRADRLFQIIQLLRRRGQKTAAILAEKLEVSERTIYRDIADLVASGTPIDGEAGVGYRLGAGYDLPPLMFDREEIEALVLGARIVERLGDVPLARASARVLGKVAAVLPKEMRSVLTATPLFAVNVGQAGPVPDALTLAREALVARRKLRLRYRDKGDAISERVVRPLGAFYWGRTWTLAAYCELRQDFRNFRVDRMADCALLADTFADEPGRTLADMMARYGPEALKLLST